MFIKKRTKLLKIIISLCLVLSLVGCNIWESITTAADNAKIIQIGENIEIALQQKDVSLFM